MVQNSSPTATQGWLQPGTLWPRIQHQTEHAVACGALLPIATTYTWIEQQDVRFLVRILANIQRKETAKQQQPKNFNPFLPYDQNLFVANLSPSHLVLLNKFNVMDHHILIVTRAYESQESLLNAADFTALALGLAEIDGLGFYNGGTLAGASQPHKHLQIVPLPFAPDGSPLPLESFMIAGVTHNPALPYRHAITSLADLEFTHAQSQSLGTLLLARYHQLLTTLALIDGTEASVPLGAYNLLVTRQWMCIVPRLQESYLGIPINSLGFTGALLVKNEEQLEHLRTIGPMTVLTQVGCAAN